jgi:tetratricopeptide (TPR) repeat protein
MYRCVVLYGLPWVFVPASLWAQERWLRGEVIHIGGNGEKRPEVNVTVIMKQTGDRDTTDSRGRFRVFLPKIFKSGEKVTLDVEKPDWRIQYPLDGETQIPDEPQKTLVEVRLLPIGSKLFWTHDRIEKFIQDTAEQSKQQVKPEGKPEEIDISRYIKDWAAKYGFNAQQAREEIDKWIADTEKNQNDLYKLGLAAFAKKNFGEASTLFNESAELKVKKLEAVTQQEKTLTDEVVRDFRLTGDAHFNNYAFDQALQAFQRALHYITKEQTPQLWAAIMLDIGRTHTELGNRTAGLDIHTHLIAAVQAYNQALEVRTRETLPQAWAMTQNDLGVTLKNQGIRTGGERGTQLLAEAVTAHRQALEVYTRETLPQDWAQTHNNLAEAYIALKDWSNAAASYANVLQIYPDEEIAYRVASGLYHEILFQFPEAFALNQHWLERHPDDLSALSDFAEKHFTTGRFTECAQRIGALVEDPAVEASTKIALRAIEIANLLALNNIAQVSDKLQTLTDSLAAQPKDFKVTWTFNGTKHFIDHSAQLASYRTWLGQLFTALEAADRQTVLTGLQAARAGLQAVAK